jgi:peptidyl-prolyl cis-trans isomerase SurA
MKHSIILTGLILLSLTVFAQKGSNQTILTIRDYQFPEGEFWHIYNKNKDLSSFTETPEQFAERFINYKLKVVDAIYQKMDTTASFVSEYGQYAEELAASYLIDSVAIEKMARGSYNNMTKLVSASHILITLPRNRAATPEDTLVAWNKIKEIRDKALAGADFNELAFEFSEDPSAKQNRGELGYFTAFQMVYPFEKVAFTTPSGKISEIVRTNFGYHIIKVQDIRPNTGKIRVAHIMKMFPRDADPSIEESLKTTIDSIYALIKNGQDFEELAKQFSDDKQSATRGGEMPPLTFGQIPVFVEEAFKLKADGEISAPVKTPFGWHIIKRLEIIPVEDYITAYPTIISMMGRDERGQIGHTALIEAKRRSPAFKINKEVWNEISLSAVNVENNDDCINKIQKNDNRTLYEYEGAKVTVTEFVEFLKNDKLFVVSEGIVSLEKSMDRMASDVILKEERKNLPRTNPTYHYLANEYHDGLLIFELSNEKIWSKVGADTVALYEHYLNYPAEFSEYPTLAGTIWNVSDAKAIKKIDTELAKNPNQDIEALIKKLKITPAAILVGNKISFAKEASNPFKTSELPEDNKYKNSGGIIYWQGTVEKGALIPYEDCKGEVMNSYQNKLEENWLKELREKYKPVFNYQLLKKKK